MGKAERPGCRAGRSQGSLKRLERLSIGSRGHLGYLTQRFWYPDKKARKAFLVLVGSGTPQHRAPLVPFAGIRKEARRIFSEKQLGKIQPAHVAFDYAKRDFSADRPKQNKTTHVAGLHAPPHPPYDIRETICRRHPAPPSGAYSAYGTPFA